MIKLTIDNKEISVPENTPVMKAAELAGIQIPAMCFMEGFTNHPSCMVCLVKDRLNGKLFASCAMPVADGMELVSDDDEVKEARREALELLLSDHIGDCEAPCRNGCPAFMDIALMNRLIAAGDHRKALVTVKEEIALPLILGHICDAPCEKVCRRDPIDQAVSICQLKKFVAKADLESSNPYFPTKESPSGKKVAIVGAGPAGMSAAFYLLRKGHQVEVYDTQLKPGGSLLQLDESILPGKDREMEMQSILDYGAVFQPGRTITGELLQEGLMKEFDAVLLATGELLKEGNKQLGVLFDAKGFIADKISGETSLAGVFTCGSAIRKQRMAVRTVAQGKEAAAIIHQYVMQDAITPGGKLFNSRFGKLKPEEQEEYLKEATSDARHEPAAGVLAGFQAAEAIAEAKRCLHCDCRKPLSCKLRIYAHEYGADRKRYLAPDRKTLSKKYNHESIVFEPEKCIKCGLCIDITQSNKELTGLTFVGRGFDVSISIPFNRTVSEALAKTAARCASACPTGAIAMKQGERDARISEE